MMKAAPAKDSESPLETGIFPVPAHALNQRIAELESSVSRLTERVSLYETIFSANPIPAIIYRLDDFKILDTNASACHLYGHAPSVLSSFTFLDLFVATSPNFEELAAALRQISNNIGPIAHRRANKKPLMVKIVLFPFAFEGVEARIAMLEDKTTRLMAEDELRASEERFRELFENANDVIFIHDLKGKIIALNRAAEAMTGYRRSEVLGRSFEDLVAPEARSQTQDNIRAHLGGSATQHYELPLLAKSGSPRYLEVSTRVVYRRGHPVAIQGIGRDITERKVAQQRLLESSQELVEKNAELSTALRLAQEATQLKEQFLANTSHELRTPMNGIMGMVNLLKTTDLDQDQNEYADAISQCANDLLTIINDLLDLSQIEAGRLALNNEQFDPAESLRAVAKMIRLRAQAKDLALDYEISESVPATICGDSVRFRQVLTNLIANAVKFTQAGGVQISLSNGHQPGTLRCEVKDSGIGVDESIRDRIFEAFFQADGTTRRRFGGTGLGLAISKQLVEIMGGEIGTRDNFAFARVHFLVSNSHLSRRGWQTLGPVLSIGPNPAFLLIVSGLLLTCGEFIWVGKVVFATAGAICVLIGISAFAQMPLASYGLIFIALSAVCFALEAVFNTFWLAGAAASAFCALGFWRLVPVQPSVSPYMAFPVSAILGTVTTWLLSIAKRARRNKRHY